MNDHLKSEAMHIVLRFFFCLDGLSNIQVHTPVFESFIFNIEIFIHKSAWRLSCRSNKSTSFDHVDFFKKKATVAHAS